MRTWPKNTDTRGRAPAPAAPKLRWEALGSAAQAELIRIARVVEAQPAGDRTIDHARSMLEMLDPAKRAAFVEAARVALMDLLEGLEMLGPAGRVARAGKEKRADRSWACACEGPNLHPASQTVCPACGIAPSEPFIATAVRASHCAALAGETGPFGIWVGRSMVDGADLWADDRPEFGPRVKFDDASYRTAYPTRAIAEMRRKDPRAYGRHAGTEVRPLPKPAQAIPVDSAPIVETLTPRAFYDRVSAIGAEKAAQLRAEMDRPVRESDEAYRARLISAAVDAGNAPAAETLRMDRYGTNPRLLDGLGEYFDVPRRGAP